MIWESFLDKTVNSDVPKKNIRFPQFARLERIAGTQADEARVETKKQKKSISANANIEAENAHTDTEKDKCKITTRRFFLCVWISKSPILHNKQLETETWNILRWVRFWILSWRVWRSKTRIKFRKCYKSFIRDDFN